MKVLLILTNIHLWRSAGRALIIWCATALVGCLILYRTGSLPFPPPHAIILSLIFSSPALVIAVPVLYYLHTFSSAMLRIVFSTGAILLACGLIVGIVSVVFSLQFGEVLYALLPFVPAAILSFFLISYKQISTSYPV